jgi:aquaglyceroporin related protein, other eukaryote
MTTNTMDVTEHEPLLSRQPRRRSTFRLPSWSDLPSMGTPLDRQASLNEVHPHLDDVEPILPSAPVAAYQETRLHKTNWALSDQPPNAWARFRHAWRDKFA